MVPNEDKNVGVAERTEAGWEGDLRRFVDDADVETAASENGPGVSDQNVKSERRTDELTR